ncbi:MAG: hypothetical protein U1D55_12950 [Phycisphaerae bacterium]
MRIRPANTTPQPPAPSGKAREAAAQAVSQLFFAPLLAEMRKLPFGTKFGNGGRGEEVFGEQLDLRLADLASRSSGNNLTALLAQRLSHTAQRADAEGA